MQRPYGELQVMLQRPVGRFGTAITFGVVDRSSTYVAVGVNENGELFWAENQPGSFPERPTLSLADDEIAALHRALNEEPVRYRGDASIEHLRDTIQERDKLFNLLTKTLDGHHEIMAGVVGGKLFDK